MHMFVEFPVFSSPKFQVFLMGKGGGSYPHKALQIYVQYIYLYIQKGN